MIPSKSLKAGFSFIEIMIALALLSIFGSSIFLVQNNIFSKVSKTHHILFFNQDAMYSVFQLKNKIYQAVTEKKPVNSIVVKEDKKNPDREIQTKLLEISNQSELKDFSKHIRIAQSSITYNALTTSSRFNIVYIPELIEEKQEPTKSVQSKTVPT